MKCFLKYFTSVFKLFYVIFTTVLIKLLLGKLSVTNIFVKNCNYKSTKNFMSVFQINLQNGVSLVD